MTRMTLQWLIFVCLTLTVLGVAALMGFISALWTQDVTYLGLSIVTAYLLATAAVGYELYRPRYASGSAIWYLCDVLERAGIVGTFIGLVLAFQALRDMDAAGEWRQHLLEGVSTKFLCSITGIVAAIFLRTQLKILGVREQ